MDEEESSSEILTFSNPSVVKESGCSSAARLPHNVNFTDLLPNTYKYDWMSGLNPSSKDGYPGGAKKMGADTKARQPNQKFNIPPLASAYGGVLPMTKITGDGRCLFRSVAYGACLRRGKQAPSDSAQKKLADELRAKVADEFVKRRGDTEWFLEGNFDNYVKQMRNPQAWGGEPELFMCSHVLRMPITVYMYTSSDDGPRIIAEYGQEYGKDDPVCVLYDGYGHYDALQPSVVLDLPQSNLWNYTGGMVGSFSELMSAASAGMMNFDGIQDCGGNQNGYKNEPFSTEIPIEDYCNGVEGAIEDYSHGDEYVVQELGISDDSEDAELEVGFEDDSEDVSEGAEVEVADYHNGAEDESSEDQGYLGGEDRHVDDDSSDDEEYLDPKQCEDRIDDSKVCIDELTGCDSSDHEEPRDGQIQKDRTANLGDCGCVTGEDQDVFSDSVEEILSDSSDSEDEQEVTIEVDLAQEFYVDKLQEGVPYKKRKRVHKGSKRPNCRKPRAMGAIERAMRSASTRDTEHIFEPKLGLVFDSRQEAREFYNMYSWEVGFGVKYNSSRPTGRKSEKKRDEEDEEEYISMQEIVCQRSGSDSRITTGTKRCGCPAKIRLHRTDDYGWYISTFVKDHNHEYSKTMGDKREWNSHREIEPNMKEMIKNLRRNNVSLTKVHCILGDMYGSMGDVPWTKRSLRTICNQIAKDQMNDDIRKTMEIFRDMHEADPGFQFSAELDKQSRIRTLLWCSGRSREQYACFGDVVTFDTTYCTNIYKMPFGLFVGVNHHFQTTIFAGVFMRRETAKSFKWVFREFLKLMGGKAPQTILTDQCKAMAKALRFVMPDTYHLWCKWHVMKKIKESLGPLYTKNKKFRDEFWLVVNGMLTEDEFEAAWADLVKRYRLEANGFMNRIYKCKKRWAKPWSKDKFCARMSSTQRSESANHMLKRFVPRNSSMNHFVSQYTRMLYDREREEDIAEHKTKQLKMVHSRLWAIERHALSIYTKAAFELFRTEVDKASNYVQSAEEGNTYTISHDNPTVREKWARVHFKVQEIDGGKRYVCECGLYEHFGILCCHTIRLLLQKHIGQIPDAHIMKRWTRDARDVLPPELKMYQKDQTSMQSNTFRHRLLNLQSVKLQAKGDTDIELFDIVMKHMRAAEKEADEVIAKRKKNAEDAPVEESTDEDSVEKETEDVGVQSDGGVLRSKAASVHSGGLLQKKHGCSSKKGPVLVRNNRYGASGSSAHYSDSEIIGMKAPYLKRKEGRPRNNRFYAGSEYKKKKLQKKESKKKDVREHASGEMGVDLEGQHDNGNGREGGKVTPKGSKREIKCGKCSMKGHNATQCCTLPINDATAALYF